jgi:hypothetical protein
MKSDMKPTGRKSAASSVRGRKAAAEASALDRELAALRERVEQADRIAEENALLKIRISKLDRLLRRYRLEEKAAAPVRPEEAAPAAAGQPILVLGRLDGGDALWSTQERWELSDLLTAMPEPARCLVVSARPAARLAPTFKSLLPAVRVQALRPPRSGATAYRGDWQHWLEQLIATHSPRWITHLGALDTVAPLLAGSESALQRFIARVSDQELLTLDEDGSLRTVLAAAARVLTSTPWQSHLLKIGLDAPRALPAGVVLRGVNMALFRPTRLPPRALARVLYAHNISSERPAAEFRQLAAAMKPGLAEFTLLGAAPRPDGGALRQIDQPAPREAADLYGASDLFVMPPSRSDLSQALAECMCMGRICLLPRHAYAQALSGVPGIRFYGDWEAVPKLIAELVEVRESWVELGKSVSDFAIGHLRRRKWVPVQRAVFEAAQLDLRAHGLPRFAGS